MIDQIHLKRLATAYIMKQNGTQPTNEYVSNYISSLARQYGSEVKVYNYFCQYFMETPEYSLQSQRSFEGVTCSCGAKYTSFPNMHMVYCDLHPSNIKG